jgi:hypothetical protein
VIGQPDVSSYGLDLDVYPASVSGAAIDLTLQATTGQDGVVASAVGLLYDL